MSADDRPSSQPSFWNERYAAHDFLFGRAPNAFVAVEADRIPRGSEVLELGAGEGRTLLWLARRRGVRGTAVDFAGDALQSARRWAEREGLPLTTIRADVRNWTPPQRWDVVLVTFLQLLPDERTALYRTIRQALRPGGLLLGEWFRPDHLTGDYDRLGPSTSDRMVPPAELREAFGTEAVLRCEAVDVELEEGLLLRGRAAVVRAAVRAA